MASSRFVSGPVRVRVPATSANLGPGFDAFGLALSLYDEVELSVEGDGLRVDVAGEGAATVSRGRDNLVVRAMDATFDALGGRPAGMRVSCLNRIPHGRGLGSSAAAVVAGVVAAAASYAEPAKDLPRSAMLNLVTALEGHPDNVAACLLGGFTIAWTSSAPDGAPARSPADALGGGVVEPPVAAAGGGVVEPPVAAARGVRADAGGGVADAVRLQPSPRVAAVVFVPPDPVATSHARGLLPDSVPHVDATRNAGRAALLVEALTRRPELLLPATEDRLHQPYRVPAMPRSAALVTALRTAGVAAVVSGAGPTVLALVDRDAIAPAAVAGLAADAAHGFEAHVLTVVPDGVEVDVRR